MYGYLTGPEVMSVTESYSEACSEPAECNCSFQSHLTLSDLPSIQALLTEQAVVMLWLENKERAQCGI